LAAFEFSSDVLGRTGEGHSVVLGELLLRKKEMEDFVDEEAEWAGRDHNQREVSMCI